MTNRDSKDAQAHQHSAESGVPREHCRLSETEREVIRIKAATQGIDSVILFVERILQAHTTHVTSPGGGA